MQTVIVTAAAPKFSGWLKWKEVNYILKDDPTEVEHEIVVARDWGCKKKGREKLIHRYRITANKITDYENLWDTLRSRRNHL